MTAYRRNRVAGGTYFFTVVAARRGEGLLLRHVAKLKAAFEAERRRAPFATVAAVILPDHLHAIWRLPPGDANYSERWRRIKAAFSRGLPPSPALSRSKQAKGELGVWQRRFWEHTIRDQDDLRRHIDYVHFNPVKHGYAKRVRDWPHSTFHAYVEKGVYPIDWAGTGVDDPGEYGEGT